MGYYHVGIFLNDETPRAAVLSASNSEGGERMLKRGHRLKIGEQGIVGNVAPQAKCASPSMWVKMRSISTTRTCPRPCLKWLCLCEWKIKSWAFWMCKADRPMRFLRRYRHPFTSCRRSKPGHRQHPIIRNHEQVPVRGRSACIANICVRHGTDCHREEIAGLSPSDLRFVTARKPYRS